MASQNRKGGSHSKSAKKSDNLFVKILRHIFIDGLNGMALGLFATLLIGTILEQIANLIPDSLVIGTYLGVMAVVAKKMMGFGIGVAVAAKFKKTPLLTVTSGVCGMIGAFASQIIAGTLVVDGAFTIPGVGEPVGAFVGAMVACEVAGLVENKTKLDIILVPTIGILSGGIVALIVGRPISQMMTAIGQVINWGAEQHPFVAGLIVSPLMGIALTLPISSAAIGVSLGLNGIAAGAATIGCCSNMVGFAAASFRENGFSGLLSQGIGTSMLQMSNILRKPVIWLPAILTSAILGPISNCLFQLTSNATGSGMGTCGLVGPWMMYQTMYQAAVAAGTSPNVILLIFKIVLMTIILPAALSLGISEAMRKLGWIKQGDMKLDL